MKIKFNRLERFAGIFVLTAVLGAVGLTLVASVQQGWFASKINYFTTHSSADGLHDGTPVFISGLNAGEVSHVELLSRGRVRMTLKIHEKFSENIREDSFAQVVRPFILSEKGVEITVGSDEMPVLKAGSEIPTQAGYDIMDLVSGKKLGPFLESVEGLMVNLSTLAEAFADPKRTQAFIRMFDRIDPLVGNLDQMSVQVTKLTKEMNLIVPSMRTVSPEIGANIGNMISRLDQITKAIAPAVSEVGGELPHASRRAIEALDEMVITLKAIQKSFLLSGKVEDVKAEEKLKRAPTSQKNK